MNNWRMSVFTWNGQSVLPKPIQTPEEQVTDPKHGPMSDEAIQRILTNFKETLGKLGDDIDENA